MFGHQEENRRKKNQVKRVRRPVTVNRDQKNHTAIERDVVQQNQNVEPSDVPNVDEGFTPVCRGVHGRNVQAAGTSVA